MSNVHPTVAAVTARIKERSKSTRASYLQKIHNAQGKGRARHDLACGNLAHAIAGANPETQDLLATGSGANIGVVTAYNDMLSAHKPYEHYPQTIRQAALHYGATAQVAGGVPAMCDGVTQGRDGMELSLFSREVIAMSTAVSMSHDCFDAALYLGVCDKIVPGLVIGALSFGHLPSVFVPAGPMHSGVPNKEKARVRQKYARGEASRDELLDIERRSYHSEGTCTFYGTANSNQMIMEMMGLQLPGSSFANPDSELRQPLTEQAVRTSVDQLGQRSLADIVSEEAIVNAAIGLMATGGSTNLTLHLPAIAAAAGIQLELEDLDELSSAIPLLCRIYPNGSADVNHFHAAGGMGFLIRELLDAGLMHENVTTILGNTMRDWATEPKLSGDGKLVFEPVDGPSGDEDILRPAANPFQPTGGLRLLTGNVGRSVIKVSAVPQENRIIEGPARVFNGQDELAEAYQQGRLNDFDFIAVIRGQGPKAIGMPELHKMTPLLANLQDRGQKVALVTDGRMSGASGKIPAAIHTTPEAISGGVIGLIRDDDWIVLNSDTGELRVDAKGEPLESRPAFEYTDKGIGMGRELFAPLRQMVGNADVGASIWNNK